MRTSALILAALAVTSGCRGSERGARDSAAATSGGVANLPLPAAVPGETPATTLSTPRGPVAVRGDSSPNSPAVLAEPLQWTADAVMQRLRDGSLAPAASGAVSPTLFGVPGLRVSVAGGAAEVQAYVFGDAGAVGVATRSFDAARASARGRRATLVVDNNLAAVIVTADEALRARLATILSARRGEGR